MTELDVEAEELEMQCEPLKFTNDIVLYIAYIGSGLVKIGYSDHQLIERIKKHQSSESKYKQFRIIGIFKISGRDIEKKVKDLIQEYRYDFEIEHSSQAKPDKQIEVYKPVKNLKEFNEMIYTILNDNDLRMRIRILEEENRLLKEENLLLKKLSKN